MNLMVLFVYTHAYIFILVQDDAAGSKIPRKAKNKSTLKKLNILFVPFLSHFFGSEVIL